MAKDNVIIRLGLDLPRFQKQLNQASSNMKKWGKDMQQVGSRLSTYLTAPLAAIGGFSVKAAADLQDIQSKFNIVFGEMAKETEAWANEFARSTNRAAGDLQKF